jgi:hypothetical protein
MPTERARLANAARALRAALLEAIDPVETSGQDRQLCERQAQSLNTFANLLTRDR